MMAAARLVASTDDCRVTLTGMNTDFVYMMNDTPEPFSITVDYCGKKAGAPPNLWGDQFFFDSFIFNQISTDAAVW